MADNSLNHVRVWVPDVWDNLRLPVNDRTTVAELKEAGLAQASRPGHLELFSVKYRGALIFNEEQTLGQLDVPENAPFIILRSRRNPVT